MNNSNDRIMSSDRSVEGLVETEKIPRQDALVEKFLSLISPVQTEIQEMYLFGSRCRDDWRPDSDYDILIVVDKKNRNLVSRLYDAVVDILIETGKLFSLKIFTTSEFNRLRSIPTPFMKRVLAEGIQLGNPK